MAAGLHHEVHIIPCETAASAFTQCRLAAATRSPTLHPSRNCYSSLGRGSQVSMFPGYLRGLLSPDSAIGPLKLPILIGGRRLASPLGPGLHSKSDRILSLKDPRQRPHSLPVHGPYNRDIVARCGHQVHASIIVVVGHIVHGINKHPAERAHVPIEDLSLSARIPQPALPVGPLQLAIFQDAPDLRRVRSHILQISHDSERLRYLDHSGAAPERIAILRTDQKDTVEKALAFAYTPQALECPLLLQGGVDEKAADRNLF
mmetsp:Transcript_8954/g.19756  ORF Transcript_8954/g.19756 Transcript_8954/m.19756 type:complete len:260 (-) Transcript_8954:649-1428(-)